MDSCKPTGQGGTPTRLTALAIQDAAPDAMGDWVPAAACATADPGIFFPDNGGPDEEAKRICGRCPVRSDCLEHSLRTGPRWGVRRGLNEAERESLARRGKRDRQLARDGRAADLAGGAA
jgi:WhiB family transcriptional regulator, redox-sensing transcriptional regulator